MFNNPRVSSTKALASLAIASALKANTTTAMAIPVVTTPIAGVPNRLSRPRAPGSRPSRAMAIGYRAAANIPALTAEAKAARAAITTSAAPTGGSSASAAVWIGARSSWSTSAGMTATATRAPRVYKAVPTTRERPIPRGMRRDGSSTSSAALATLVSPP